MSAAKLLALGLVPAAFASAIPAPALSPRASAMQLSDRFAVSGLDHSTWVAKMVNEGKLVVPSQNNTASFRAAAGLFDLSNIVCGVLISGTTSLERSRDRACNFMREYAGAVTYGFQYITNEEFCQAADDDTCTNIVDAIFAIAGAYIDGGVVDNCPAIFDEIASQCPGGVGGSADITVTRNDGQTFSGSVGTLNFEDDTGTCPANPITDSEICRAELAG